MSTREILSAGAETTAKLLNSGHLVVTVFMLLTIILLGIVIWLLRENKRLSMLNSDIIIRVITAFKSQETQIELLLARLRHGG